MVFELPAQSGLLFSWSTFGVYYLLFGCLGSGILDSCFWCSVSGFSWHLPCFSVVWRLEFWPRFLVGSCTLLFVEVGSGNSDFGFQSGVSSFESLRHVLRSASPYSQWILTRGLPLMFWVKNIHGWLNYLAPVCCALSSRAPFLLPLRVEWVLLWGALMTERTN